MNPMPSESNKTTRTQHSMGFPPPPQSEPLPCPRCDSLNTKFCYYNNYNLSQPRHFCKSCRRYWTQGGTLRDVPIGGATRKTSKRSRYHNNNNNSSSIATSSISSSSSSSVDINNINNVPPTPPPPSFTSLLTSHGPGFLALGGYASAHAGFDELGFGLGRGLWGSVSTYPEVGDPVGPPETSSYSAWQMSGAEGGGRDGNGVVDGDLLGWPDLAISMQGNSFK